MVDKVEYNMYIFIRLLLCIPFLGSDLHSYLLCIQVVFISCAYIYIYIYIHIYVYI